MADIDLEAGKVAVELDGKEMILVPTLDACIRISAIAGGLNAAVQRCLQLDMNTICEIIIAGLGVNPTQAKAVPQAVFKTGLIKLSGPCIDFIHIVGNGGRALSDEEDGGGEDEAGPLPPA